MGHPATTNPLIIMMINMTVVFIVLVSLIYVIKLIHFFDPTKVKEKETPAPTAKVAPTPAPEPVQVVEEGIPQEVIAVICAAINAYGYSTSQIHAIHPVHNTLWEHSGRYHFDQ